MKTINSDIEKSTFRHAYLLYGDERYLKRQYTDRLRKALCSDGDQMNTHFYTGKNLPLGEIIDLAETLPFLAERRVIFLSDSELFSSGGEKLAEYLSSPNETTYFVFTETNVDKRSKLYKTVQSMGYAAEFSAQDEEKLKKWIAGILGKEGKKITESTAMLLLQKTGNDMENIQMETEKLICYCMDRDIVTAEDVETICTDRVSNHIFDMINAIADGKEKKALQLYYDLLALKEPPMRILILIARQYNLLLQVKELRDHGYDAKAIAPKVGLSPYVAGKYLAQSGRFKTSALKSAVEQCVEAEQAITEGKLIPVMSVEILIVSMLNLSREK